MNLLPAMGPPRRALAHAIERSDERLWPLRRELIEVRERQLRAVAAAAAELAEFARSDRAPRALQAVQRRIDRGELSWERVALGDGGVLPGLLGDRLAGLPEAFARARELVEDGVPPEEAVRRTRDRLARQAYAGTDAGPDWRAGR